MAKFKKVKDEMIASPNITPLINVMLVILVTFLLVSTFIEKVNSDKADVKLPFGFTGKKQKENKVVVTINQKGEYFVDGEVASDAAAVEEKLRMRKKSKKDTIVIISADKNVFHEEIVKMINIIKKSEIYSFGINVDPVKK